MKIPAVKKKLGIPDRIIHPPEDKTKHKGFLEAFRQRNKEGKNIAFVVSVQLGDLSVRKDSNPESHLQKTIGLS